MSRYVSGGIEGAERADEVAFREQQGRLRFDRPDASLDFSLRLVGLQRSIGWLLQQRHAPCTADQLYVATTQLFDQRIDRTHMVHVCMGKHDAANRDADLPCGRENVIGRTGETRVDQAEAISLTNQVTIDEAQAGELISVGSHTSGLHPKN